MKLTIGQKVFLAYGLGALCLAITGMAAYRSTGDLLEANRSVQHTILVIDRANGVKADLVEAESAQRGYLLTGEDRYLESADGLRARITEGARQVRELTADNPAQQRRLDSVNSMIGSRLAALGDLVTVRREKGLPAAIQAVGKSKGLEHMAEIRRLLAEMVTAEQTLLQDREQLANAGARTIRQVVLYGSLVGIGVLAFLVLVTHQSITRPLADFQRFMTAAGEGDLSKQSAREGDDQMGKLARSLNQMMARMREVAVQTRSATENLAATTAQILSSANEQAAGSRQQLASCQETNATMQQVSQSAHQIAERARQVAATAEAASKAYSTGVEEAVQRTSQSIEAIREQAEAVTENVVSLSEKTHMVGDIIATVNDIAEQSHLLALNAAIEAAAAGEHGRSFSVVAGEIKNLADQSKEATIQVKTILGDIQKGINTSVMLTEEAVKRVDQGKQQAEVAASRIRDMSASIDQSVQAFQQIVAGTNQQQIGFENVLQAVKSIGQASEQASVSNLQMEKAANNLTELGQQLRGATERYRL